MLTEADLRDGPKICCLCGAKKAVRPLDGPRAVIQGRVITKNWQCVAARPCSSRQSRMTEQQKMIHTMYTAGYTDTLEEEPALVQIAAAEEHWAARYSS